MKILPILKKTYYYVKNKIIYHKIYRRYGVRLKTFKDIHKGERCFIIGNGPSLKIQDLEKLRNEYTFAANKIFIAFEETDWRPTYYCIQDFLMILSEIELLKNIDVKNKFIAGNPLVFKKIYWNDWLYFYIDISPFYPNHPMFSEDISKQIFEGYTVTYAEIQLAVYMGFKEIYLLGVDFNYAATINNLGEININSESENYFSNKYMANQQFGVQLNYPNLENSLLAYKAAKQYAEKNGIKIFNVTRGGKLELFERMDFDKLI